jgi:hypothetical protein
VLGQADGGPGANDIRHEKSFWVITIIFDEGAFLFAGAFMQILSPRYRAVKPGASLRPPPAVYAVIRSLGMFVSSFADQYMVWRWWPRLKGTGFWGRSRRCWNALLWFGASLRALLI